MQRFSESDFFHREILERLIDRLDTVKISPKRILMIGMDATLCGEKLKARYPEAVIQEDPRFRESDERYDLIFSNLFFHTLKNPEQFFKDISRQLKPNGLLMFTMLGPDTLKEVRFAWMSADDKPHVHDFYDMHDIGDCLMQSSFVEPVMDMEHLSVHYKNVDALFLDLKNTASTNVSDDRRKTLTGKKRFNQFLKSLENAKIDDKYVISFEVIYGHAWGGVMKEAGVVEIPLAFLTSSRPT